MLGKQYTQTHPGEAFKPLRIFPWAAEDKVADWLDFYTQMLDLNVCLRLTKASKQIDMLICYIVTGTYKYVAGF